MAWEISMRTLGFCLVGCLCSVLAACGSRGSTAKDSIVGTWHGIDRGTTIVGTWVFTKEGKLTKTVKSVDMPGTSEWVDADHIKTEVTMPGGATTIKEKHKVSVTKDTLTLTNEQGTTNEFKRAQ
jgi:hypothetical protein